MEQYIKEIIKACEIDEDHAFSTINIIFNKISKESYREGYKDGFKDGSISS